MAQINVYCVSANPEDDPQKFRVEVESDDGSKTNHEVTLNNELYIRLTGGIKSMEELIKYSFNFLLDKEPKESILPTFDISEIKKYFPEFEQVIAMQLAK